MKVAVLCDIHGNLPALEAVLDELRQEEADLIVVGGDVVPGPMSQACLERLRRLGDTARFLHGNGEQDVLTRLEGGDVSHHPDFVQEILDWEATRLRPAKAWLESWPLTVRVDIPGLGHVLFCHATPRSTTDIFTKVTPEDQLAGVFEDVDADVVVCGHTHMQFDRQIAKVHVLNAGSVGMPIGETGAHWLLLGPGVEFRRTPYDLEAAAGRMENTSYPQATEVAARYVLTAPSEEETLALFTPVEIGRR